MSAAQPSRVAELFGVPTSTTADWARIVAEQNCPFTAKRCFKVRKSDPSTAIGTCVVRAGKSRDPMVICPNRLLADRRVLTDALGLLAPHQSDTDYHLIPEVRIPGGKVDYFIVAVKEDRPFDFVGVEFQALDTTGTVWPQRQQFLAQVGAADDHGSEDARRFHVNWKMTAKTILVQLHHKTRAFEEVGRKLVLVLQQELMDYMAREFSFAHVSDASDAHPLHFHPYRLVPNGGRLELELGTAKSTDAEGIAKALRLGDETLLTSEEILGRLESRMGDDTRWRPGASPAPSAIPDVSDD